MEGWWGDNPPYHTPVFVLTHHARPSITMEGGTTFHFVTGGTREALTRARDAAKDQGHAFRAHKGCHEKAITVTSLAA